MKPLKNIAIISLFTTAFYTISALADVTLAETNNLVKAGGKFVTLIGTQINDGDTAPNFKVVDENFSPISLDKFAGKTILISVVPSLDTGVCSLQTKRFNDEISELSDDVVILTISNDLPFAQKRFCKEENVDQIKVLSDAVWRDFGHKYGLLIKDMGLLTRAIFIIDNQGVVAYKELVENISSHPNYEMALSIVKALSPLFDAELTPEADTQQNVTSTEEKVE